MTRALLTCAAFVAVLAQVPHGPAFALASLAVLALSVLCGALAHATDPSTHGWDDVSGDRSESAILRKNGRESVQHQSVTAADHEHARARCNGCARAVPGHIVRRGAASEAR